LILSYPIEGVLVTDPTIKFDQRKEFGRLRNETNDPILKETLGNLVYLSEKICEIVDRLTEIEKRLSE
jgi:hypothetical protein